MPIKRLFANEKKGSVCKRSIRRAEPCKFHHQVGPQAKPRARLPSYTQSVPRTAILAFKALEGKETYLTQPNSIELSIRNIPSAITNIPTLNRHSVPLGPGVVRLAAPVHTVWIRIAGFHILLLGEVGVSGLAHVLHEHLGTGVAVRAVGWLADVEGGVAGRGIGRRLDVIVGWRYGG